MDFKLFADLQLVTLAWRDPFSTSFHHSSPKHVTYPNPVRTSSLPCLDSNIVRKGHRFQEHWTSLLLKISFSDQSPLRNQSTLSEAHLPDMPALSSGYVTRCLATEQDHPRSCINLGVLSQLSSLVLLVLPTSSGRGQIPSKSTRLCGPLKTLSSVLGRTRAEARALDSRIHHCMSHYYRSRLT